MTPPAATTGAGDQAAAVAMHGICKDFPGVRALDHVTFEVARGEVHALVGKNGAGKSTLMHVLKGLLAPDAGSIRVGAATYARLSPAESRKAGIALVSQHARFVPGLSIAENVFTGGLPLRRFGFVDWRRLRSDAAERLRRFGLDIDVRRPMEATSIAERQMIEIARALFAQASVIILDEPTAPLPKHDVARLFDFVRRQREGGAAFIYISHYLEEIFQIADRVTVLRNGQVVGAEAVAAIDQPALIRLISGSSVERYRRAPATPGAAVLQVDGLSRDGAYADVTLTLHAGEIVGLTGLEGSGPGALARGLFGLEPLGRGTVTLDGRPYRAQTPTRALAQGLAYLPRDRHGLGIVAMRPVRENVTLSVLRRMRNRLGFLAHRRERRIVADYVAALRIKTPSAAAPVGTLSGGNQQKVVVAKLAATEPRVLLLDEPTQGVDVEAKVELLRIIDQLGARGLAAAVVSDELSELMDICDRILVFHRGRIVQAFAKATGAFDAARILAAIEGEVPAS